MYPFPSIGTFLFKRSDSEVAIFESDEGWQLKPRISNIPLLGSPINSVQLLGFGSQERIFEIYLSPSRYSELKARIGTTAEFTDWEQPVPTSRNAFLSGVNANGGPVQVTCSDGITRFRYRVTITLISQ